MSHSPIELQRRLLYAALRPAVRLAQRFHVPLKTLEALTRLAYYEALRRDGGLPQTRIAEVFDKSLRTITSLERELRGDFLAPQRAVERARDAEAACQTPKTADEVAHALGLPTVDAQRILDGLVGAGRVTQEGARYVTDPAYHSLVGAALPSRLDGLTHQLDVITDAVIARFLAHDEPALARTLAFMGTDATIAALSEDLATLIRTRCGEAEEAALSAGVPVRAFGLTVALAATAPATPDEEDA